MTSTKEGSVTLAIGAAIVAGLLILLFVTAYKDDVNGDNASESVFVARALIPKGSSASIIASQQLLQRTSLKGKDVKSGAIKDPSTIAGQVAAQDIAPGQQITSSSFTSGGEGVASELAGTDRAISVPVDAAHSVNGQVHAGDHVDVLVGFAGSGAAAQPSLRTVLQNVTVLSGVSGSGGGVGNNDSGSGNVTLRVTDRQATLLAFAADNGRIWLTLRPPAGAKQNPPSVATTGVLFARTATPATGGK